MRRARTRDRDRRVPAHGVRRSGAVCLALLLAAAVSGCGAADPAGETGTRPSPTSAAASPGGPDAASPTPGATTATGSPDAGEPQAPAPAPAPAPDTADGAADGGTDAGEVSAVLVSVEVDAGGGVMSLSGYVAGTVSEGRPCVYELRNGAERRSVTTQSVADATVTSCPGGELPLDGLTAGRWEARLAYPDRDVASAWSSVDVP